MMLAGIGLILGLAVVLVLARFLTSMLYGVSPNDPVTFVGISFLLAMVALLACYLPARRGPYRSHDCASRRMIYPRRQANDQVIEAFREKSTADSGRCHADQFAKLLQVYISAGDDRDNRTIAGFST
jgi:hypothetical protein